MTENNPHTADPHRSARAESLRLRGRMGGVTMGISRDAPGTQGTACAPGQRSTFERITLRVRTPWT